MFDQLLQTFQETFKQARKTSGELQKQFRQTQAQFGIPENNFHDPTRKLGKAISFGKSDRWKEMEKEEIKVGDCALAAIGTAKTEHGRGPVFGKSDRFRIEKHDQLTIINPNYDVVKKNNKQAPKIAPVTQKQLNKSRLSQATATSQTEIGPGKYFPSQTQTVPQKKPPTFPKSRRFPNLPQQSQDTPLFICQTQTKKRAPSSAILKKPVPKNPQQISVSQQQSLRERLKLIYWKSIPLQLDRLVRRHQGVPVLREKYFDLRSMGNKERKCALLMLLNRLDYQRGGFCYDLQGQFGDGKGNCGVVYRKSAPKPLRFGEMEPGPDYYYPLDDLTKPGAIGFTFGKQQQKPAKPDNRDYEINQQYFKPGGNILILPQHKPHQLTEQQVRSLNLGPGFYNCLFSKIERRADIGITKFPQISSKNARQNNCTQLNPVNDGVYFPNFTSIDPNIPAPLYSKPSQVKPMHTPEKLLFPEHWLFYDGDLNKVRAEIAKNVLIGNGLDYHGYQLFTRKFRAFKDYMDLRKKEVQGLEYSPNYQAVDPHVQGFEMAKKPEKTLIYPIVKDQFDVDGDNLILQAEKIKKRVPYPQVKFDKMTGREQDQPAQDDQIQGDVLVLNPSKPKKHIPQIDFNKIPSRPEPPQKNPDEEPAEGDRIILNPVLPEKKLANVDFSRQVPRDGPGDLGEPRQEKEELVIMPEQPKKVKGFVDMERMTSVRLVPYLRKKRQEKASVIKPRSISKISEHQSVQQPDQQN